MSTPSTHETDTVERTNEEDARPGSSTAGGDDGEASKQVDDAASREGGAPQQQSQPMSVPSDEPELEAEAEDEVVGDEGLAYPEADEEDLLPPPDFKPFYTIIEASDTGEHHHPTVHYIFADDDPEILTSAALETLSSHPEQQEQQELDERFVILDLDSTGKEIVSASSLSPDWQALKTHISPAPSWGGDDSKDADRGLMLRISGQEASRAGNVKDSKTREGDIDCLLRTFDEDMGDLDGVLGTASATDTHEAQQEELAK